MSVAPETGGLVEVLGAAAVAAGGSVMLIYKAVRGLKSDGRQDATLADMEARLKIERERADLFARERMEKSEENATMKATLSGLNQRLDALEASVKAKDIRIDALEREVESLEAAYDILVEEAAMTNVLLQQAGHEEIIKKVQQLTLEREEAMRLLRLKRGANQANDHGTKK